jgi:hypothetical protein
MAAGSASVDVAVKWRLNPRKRFVCSTFIPHNLWSLFKGVFGGSFIKVFHEQIQFSAAVIGWDTSLVTVNVGLLYRPQCMLVRNVTYGFSFSSCSNCVVNKQTWALDRGCSSCLGVEMRLTTGMNRQNFHFFAHLLLLQMSLIVKLGVSPSWYCSLTLSHSLSSGDSTTGHWPQCWDEVSPRHNYQCTNNPSPYKTSSLRNVTQSLGDTVLNLRAA